MNLVLNRVKILRGTIVQVNAQLDKGYKSQKVIKRVWADEYHTWETGIGTEGGNPFITLLNCWWNFQVKVQLLNSCVKIFPTNRQCFSGVCPNRVLEQLAANLGYKNVTKVVRQMQSVFFTGTNPCWKDWVFSQFCFCVETRCLCIKHEKTHSF